MANDNLIALKTPKTLEGFNDALRISATGLSTSTISRLKAPWVEEQTSWQKRSLKPKRYVYVWADGVYFTIRHEDDRQCLLVLIGVTDTGHKELLGLEAGLRESNCIGRLDCAPARPGTPSNAGTRARRWRFGVLESA